MNIEILFLDGISLGQRVRIARLLKRWRQVDLAQIAAVTQTNVSSLERGASVFPAARLRILNALDLEDPCGKLLIDEGR